jgi:eukaryotic-like serine/threonine-protein kinase
MAIVYLAEDLKHKRKVAVKVLRPELAAVLGAERFVQEITTTANLQHPHILPLFDSGEADGFLFYVMPYIEGETLRDKLNRETQLGIDEAVSITIAIAEALDAAHQQGVIHRDIKPENILLHNDLPMVADFGIALAVSAAAGGRMTETGLSLGTPHYMSPEQATAEKDLTARSDVYSLGCMLYEMLTGEPPHTGASAQAIVMKIVTDDARPVTELRKSVPPHVAAATAKSLEKLAADRFATAKGFAEALTNQAFTLPATQAAAGVGARRRGPWNRVSIVTTAVAVITTVITLWSWLRAPPEVSQPVTRVSVLIPEEQSFSGSGRFDISLDGSLMVYEGQSGGGVQLWARRWDALDATPIRDTDGANRPAISPDGQEVAFNIATSIRVVPLQGGVSRTLATDSVSCCVRWSPDGVWLYFYDLAQGLSRVPAAGGPIEVVTQVDAAAGDVFHAFMEILPGGKAAVYQVNGVAGSRLLALDLETGEAKELSSGQFPRYSSGYLLFGTPDGTTLMAAPFDVEKLEFTGSATPVAEGLRAPIGGNNYFAVSQTGKLIYAAGSAAQRSYEVVWVTREGQVTAVDPDWTFDPGDNNRGVALSPDGTRLAVSILNESEREDIWIKQLPRGPVTRLTFHDAQDVRPRWTPSGDAVTFLSEREGAAAVFVKRASGTGMAELLLAHDQQLWEALFSPDGEWLIARTGGQAQGTGGRDVWAIRPGVDTLPLPLVVTDFDEKAIALSPDGRWLAYESDETGRNEVYVRPFPDVDDGKWTVSIAGGVMPVWAHSGRELFYVNADGEMVTAQIQPGADFAVTDRTVLFAIDPALLFRQNEQYALYDVAPDDQRFLMLRAVSFQEAGPELILVENFFEELREQVGN